MKKLTFLFLLTLLPLMASSQIDLTGATVTLTPTSFDYDGTAHEPKVYGIRKGTQRYNSLVEGVDYDITYSDNVNAGTSTAILTFKGDYTGVATKTFTIVPIDLYRKVTVELEKDEFDYDGTTKEPAISDLYYGDIKLINGVDYDLSYINNIEPGTATATVTFKGNYTGSAKADFNIKINLDSDFVLKGSCGENVNYSFDNKSGVLSITGTGEMWNYSSYSSPWYSQRSYIKTIEIADGITTIGNCSFADCSSLTKITIPNSVTSIGGGAFSGCYGLPSIELPNSVISIGDAALGSCYGLTSITIPNSVTSIGNRVFSDCSNLIKVVLDNNTIVSKKYSTNLSLKSIFGEQIEEYILGNSVTSIGEYAFNSCSGLTSITIPNSVTTIGNWAFEGCSSLTSVTIPNGVTSIGLAAFRNCSGLTSISIPKSVTEIKSGTFEFCTNLASITIPNSVTSIERYAFRRCPSLISISVESNNPNYDSRDNCNAIIESSTNSLILGCKNTIIPSSVTSIGERAFIECYGLTSIIIPNRVTSIEEWAFFGCYGLTSITIPNSVTSIGNEAFEGCSGLTSVTIPNSVTSMGQSAFSNCSGLKSVTILNRVIGGAAFYRCSGLTSVTIGSCVNSIGSNAFYECYSLKEVHTSDIASWCNISFVDSNSNPLSYAHHLFMNGEEIKDLVIPNSITSIGKYAFAGCSGLTSVTIPYSVESIGRNAFAYCSDLKSIPIPNSIKSIESGTFSSCYKLESVTIPNSVKSIGENAFSYCYDLAYITIPSSVTSIKKNVFANCYFERQNFVNNSGYDAETNNYWGATIVDSRENGFIIKEGILLKYIGNDSSVVIPNNITTIRDYAFYECKNLKSVTIPNSVTSIGEYAFYKLYFEEENFINKSTLDAEANNYWGATIVDSRENGFVIKDGVLLKYCGNKTFVTIPSSVTSIGNYAFYECSALKSITIPNSVKSIGVFAFSKCYELTSINIPKSVKSIGFEAFSYCTSLTCITIPSSVTSIEEGAFSYCVGLTEIYCFAKDVPNTSASTFNRTNIKTASLYIPESSFAAYQSAVPWNEFGNIVALPNVLHGDVNGDDVVNGTDIQAVINIIVDGEYDEKADVNEDGTVNGTDIQEVINIIVNEEYFYLGTTKPTLENYKSLSGGVTPYTSIEDALGTTVFVLGGETIYMLLPSSWMQETKIKLEDENGLSFYFSDRYDSRTISGYSIYEVDVSEESKKLILRANRESPFLKDISIEAENPSSVDSVYYVIPAGATPNKIKPSWISRDVKSSSPFYEEVMGHKYCKLQSNTSSMAGVIFNVTDILSDQWYDLYVVTVPPTLSNLDQEDDFPTRIQATILCKTKEGLQDSVEFKTAYIPLKTYGLGKIKIENFGDISLDDDYTRYKPYSYETDPTTVHKVHIGRIMFPSDSFDLRNTIVKLRIEVNVLSTSIGKTKSKNLYIDRIFLSSVKDE